LEAATEVTTLKAEMKIITKLKKNIGMNGYEIGIRLNKIHDQELYKEGGVYKNFSAFARKPSSSRAPRRTT
jgi:hypothetical protein